MKAICIIALVIVCCAAFPRHIDLHLHYLRHLEQSRVSKIPYSVTYYTQTLDHFDFSNSQTFQQKILFNDQWFRPGCPIFFYAGNEGDVTLFWDNTGFMFEIAPEFCAAVVFAEHRYYGETLPFGPKDSFSADKIRWLSSEQALADYAELILHLKDAKYGDVPVVVFGGSYGGMLASWMRIKYPHVVSGAIASSAPILMFEGLVSPNTFYKIATEDFTKISPTCSTLIRKGLQTAISQLTDPASISRSFRLCDPISSDQDRHSLNDWAETGFTYMATTDYPYASDFLQSMPAWPVEVACKSYLTDASLSGEKLMTAVANAVGVYYNSTGKEKCFDTNQSVSNDLGLDAWDYQSCTEMVFPIGTNGVTDMFVPAPWDLNQFNSYCQKRWGVMPRSEWVKTYYGGKRIKASSNIVFSNGELDPWRGGGVQTTINPSVVAIYIEKGAHHLDLRSSNPADPQSVIIAREEEKIHIRKWIEEHKILC